MTTINSHATLTDFGRWLATRGLAGSVGTDTSDDAVIENLLVAASRYADGERTFYPRIETRYYDLPDSVKRRGYGHSCFQLSLRTLQFAAILQSQIA